jgi:hypothetical protein
MIASFVVGFIAGIIALLAFAVQYVDRKETEAMQRDNRIAAVGMDLNGNGGISIDPDSAYLLRKVFKNLEQGIS